jgi:hypothetical protein
MPEIVKGNLGIGGTAPRKDSQDPSDDQARHEDDDPNELVVVISHEVPPSWNETLSDLLPGPEHCDLRRDHEDR